MYYQWSNQLSYLLWGRWRWGGLRDQDGNPRWSPSCWRCGSWEEPLWLGWEGSEWWICRPSEWLRCRSTQTWLTLMKVYLKPKLDGETRPVRCFFSWSPVPSSSSLSRLVQTVTVGLLLFTINSSRVSSCSFVRPTSSSWLHYFLLYVLVCCPGKNLSASFLEILLFCSCFQPKSSPTSATKSKNLSAGSPRKTVCPELPAEA